MLLLAVPSQVQAVDLGQLLADTRARPPVPTLTCQGQGVCAGSQVPSILVGTPGQVMVLHLVRNLGGAGAKVLTPVTLPQANHAEWPSLQPSVVLAFGFVYTTANTTEVVITSNSEYIFGLSLFIPFASWLSRHWLDTDDLSFASQSCVASTRVLCFINMIFIPFTLMQCLMIIIKKFVRYIQHF